MTDSTQDVAHRLKSLPSLIGKGKIDEAIQVLRECLEIEPHHPVALIQLGELLRHTPDIVFGVELLRKGLAIQPTNTIGWLSLASALRALSQPDGAQAAFRTVLDLDPDRIEALNDLGTLLMDQLDWDGAILLFRRASELAPGTPGIRINLARALAQDGRSVEALDIVQTVVATHPNVVGIAQLISELTRPVTPNEMSQSLAGPHYNLKATSSNDQMLIEPELKSANAALKAT
jgi:tetratricopeptide (TPR) repeat protein